MTDMADKLYEALATLSKAGWDANNVEEVDEARVLLRHFIAVMDEHGCIEANEDELEDGG
jgi:hypothetical protein